ncbi:MAG: hypothetical protein HC837_13955 [Chloroflexaceae bacterium]|nr:hypothetical protein [Chloroflexaceae bacterium]
MILFQRIPSVRALFVLCVGLLLFSACSLNQAASGSQERVVLTPLATITPVPTAVLDQPTLTLAGEDPMTEPTATVEEPTGVPTAVPPTAEPTATEEPAADEPVATEEAGSSEPAGDDGLTQVDFGQLVDYTHPSELFSLLLPGAWDIVSESTELPILLRVRPPGMITAIARVDVLVDQDPERALLSREDFYRPYASGSGGHVWKFATV